MIGLHFPLPDHRKNALFPLKVCNRKHPILPAKRELTHLVQIDTRTPRFHMNAIQTNRNLSSPFCNCFVYLLYPFRLRFVCFLYSFCLLFAYLWCTHNLLRINRTPLAKVSMNSSRKIDPLRTNP